MDVKYDLLLRSLDLLQPTDHPDHSHKFWYDGVVRPTMRVLVLIVIGGGSLYVIFFGKFVG